MRLLSCHLLWICILFAHGPAFAQWGKSSSLFSADGVEVSLDTRVFGVYALLNAIGYDAEVQLGEPPLHRPQFSAPRQEVRSRMGRPGPASQMMKKIVTDFPLPASAYTKAAIELGAAPKFVAPPDASPLAKALVAPLQSWHNEEGGAATFRAVTPMSSAAQKKVLSQVDALCATLAQNVNLGSEEDQLLDDSGTEGRVVVILNELDAHGTLVRAQQTDTTYLVSGPAKDERGGAALTHATALAFARTLYAGEVKKNASKAGLAEQRTTLTKDAQAVLPDAESYLTEVLACGLLRKVLPEAKCAGSVLANDAGAMKVVNVIVKRLQAAGPDALLSEQMPVLVAAFSADEVQAQK